MKPTILALLLMTLAALGAYASQAHADDDSAHHVAVHVDQNDPFVMNMALNNVANLQRYYEEKGESVAVEVVAYGPGLHMLRADTSPVKERIEMMSLESDRLTFSACGNTRTAMSRKAGHDIDMLDESTMVPSGIVRLVELQEQGYAYVRP